jgi:nicotinamidase-related amidase
MAKNRKPALIVVDMQNDFINGSLAVPDADSIVGVINQLLESDLPFVKRIATKDCHPPNHISFASTHDKPAFSTITIYPPGEERDEAKAIEQVLWPTHCVASTPGAEFPDKLHSAAFDAVVHKGTDRGVESYSAFQDPWKISTTDLPRLLSESGVTDVFVCGVAGDYCVKCTALDAKEFGYRTWVVRDAVRSVSKSGDEWKEMEERGVNAITSEELVRILGNY